ncbi:hypothetical protein OQZ33_11405 [Pedobacter sp. MC2016-05]|uniref:CBU_0592 family membrane protein n=1 Tax=Pedobacter sp. MC2016-05 TaxID=2994474 RepID=UPI0022475D87|nr:hypothetical protein [Pedobacter sp. MC2016-05]MCX2474937.1 hypothetical protein [Pedobacter sp. MC2016-05]
MHQLVLNSIFDTLGWIGALLFLISYFLLISKRWSATSFAFHLCNILGGVLLSASTLYDASYPATFVNLAWAMIAGYGMYNDQIKKHKPDS